MKSEYARGWADAMKAAKREFEEWTRQAGRRSHYMINGRGVVATLARAIDRPGEELES